MINKTELTERLAQLEHDQWRNWASNVLFTEKKLSKKRFTRWVKLFKPYSFLNDREKESDRFYARKIIELLIKEGILK